MKHWPWLVCLLFAFNCAAEVRDPNQHFFQTTVGDYRAEFEQARAEGKRAVVFVFEMDECPFCHRMHTTVLDHSEVQDAYGKHFSVFRIDIKGNAPVTDAEGRATTEREMARRSRVRGVPTTVFYAPDGKELARYVGPPRDAAEYLLLARYVIDGEYEGKTFRQFRQGAK